HDVTVRGAVSIGRRLMDPLAELVQIDPKSIGVGQYQHDVNQFRLKEKLDQTVVSCVNQVGVNLNTASKHLLQYVSGIGGTLAENIIRYRSEIGGFKSRQQLLKVPRLGGKAYEQCAGFLRVPKGEHPLDATAVHPEAYPLVEQMAKDLGLPVQELVANESNIKQIDP
ncbi:MAG: helix-hairpin-helix domain-containing protein, partial [Methylophilaceae bacterium]